MKTIKSFMIAAVCMLGLMLSSCGVSQHNTGNTNLNNSDVVLAQKNYHIVKTVQGESEQTYVLGIGGLSRKSTTDDAIREMYRNANLSGSQAIINTTVTHSYQFYLLAWRTKAVATGIVIEFDK